MSGFRTTTILLVITTMGLGLSLEDPFRWLALVLLWTGYILICIFGVAILKLNFFVQAICRGDSTEKLVTLTFDDGPGTEGTPTLLEILKLHEIKAAFFPIGTKIKAHPEMIRRIDQDGHLIGNHTYRHRWYTNFLISKPLNREIQMAQETIAAVIGKVPAYFRPPIGLTNPHLRKVLKKQGLSVVGWDVRPFDIGTKADKVIKRVLKKMRPGSIILLHDKGRTPADWTRLIDELVSKIKARGFRFADPERLIGKRAYQTPEGGNRKEFFLFLQCCFASGSGWRRLLRPFASKLAASLYVQRALKERVPLDVFKDRPSPKFFFGLGLMLFSYVLGWPMVGLFTVLSGYFRNPALLIAGPAFYGFSHLVFLLGLFLTGGDCLKYGDILLRWGLHKTVEKASGRET
ncbi:MAG: polysaccharide deacetylase family protein [Thermodesulfobacteriota bacterium]